MAAGCGPAYPPPLALPCPCPAVCCRRLRACGCWPIRWRWTRPRQAAQQRACTWRCGCVAQLQFAARAGGALKTSTPVACYQLPPTCHTRADPPAPAARLPQVSTAHMGSQADLDPLYDEDDSGAPEKHYWTYRIRVSNVGYVGGAATTACRCTWLRAVAALLLALQNQPQLVTPNLHAARCMLYATPLARCTLHTARCSIECAL